MSPSIRTPRQLLRALSCFTGHGFRLHCHTTVGGQSVATCRPAARPAQQDCAIGHVDCKKCAGSSTARSSTITRHLLRPLGWRSATSPSRSLTISAHLLRFAALITVQMAPAIVLVQWSKQLEQMRRIDMRPSRSCSQRSKRAVAHFLTTSSSRAWPIQALRLSCASPNRPCMSSGAATHRSLQVMWIFLITQLAPLDDTMVRYRIMGR